MTIALVTDFFFQNSKALQPSKGPPIVDHIVFHKNYDLFNAIECYKAINDNHLG